jgi:hypothetical protein
MNQKLDGWQAAWAATEPSRYVSGRKSKSQFDSYLHVVSYIHFEFQFIPEIS